MSERPEVRAEDLTPETTSTLSGNEQFIMFDDVEGKRADIDDVATYIAGDKTQLQTTDKTSPVAAINELKNGEDNLKEDLSDVPTETTGQALLREEEQNTVYEQYMLDTLSRIFDGLPTDETAEDIVAELIEENSWLDQLTREIITE